MSRKRLLEIGSTTLLILLVAGLVQSWLRYRSLNDRLTSIMADPNLVQEERAEVHRLLRKGASLYTEREDGYNLLMLAARNGDLPLLRETLQRGIPVSSRSASGWTPLMEAMASGDEECVRALIDAGADLNARDAAGRTPLMLAAEFQFRGGINLLLGHGAQINARNRKGQTVLAYVRRHPGLTTLLRQYGARN